MFLDLNRNQEDVADNLTENKGLLLGIKANDKLQGYCQYEPQQDDEVEIVWFCANQTFGTPLYIFMEKYFERNNYTKILLNIELDDRDVVRKLNLWYRVGFTCVDVELDVNIIRMEKSI